MKIALASIHARTVPFTFMQERDRVLNELVEMGAFAGITSATGPYVDINRNDCVEMFLNRNADYLLFLDDDMAFPSWLVARLLQADADLVSGLYFQRGAGFYPHFYKYLGHYPGKYGESAHHYQSMTAEVREALADHKIEDRPTILPEKGPYLPIDAGGCGCLLIKREVLQTLFPPWFYNEKYLHEDFNFYRDAKAAGFKAVGDAGCICAHQHTALIGAKSFLAGEVAGT